MKKCAALALCLAICLSMAGCTNDTGGVGSTSSITKNQDGDGTSRGSAFAANAGTTAAKTDYDSLKNNKIGWGQGREMDDKNRPVAAVETQQKLGDEYNAAFIGTEEKVLYLTFDQGYENGYTGKILDTLKEKQVPATFFLTYDYCKEAPDLCRRMVAEGHTLGNHSQKHKSFPTLTVSEATADIDFMHQYVKETFGYDMKVFRFPMGEYSERMLAVVRDYGYKSLFWSYAYKDWVPEAQPDKAESLEKLKKNLHPGAIFLLHSVSSTNTAILGDFIDYALSQGYTFQTM
ncbi:polysaccharide deacetylase family protein [Bittarella massiliensis (ex Durand et al. 2017)]|uniref:polysaccharide deacetylase family protein n=1 Tax=Bittarella massiliensis (ex Durand et al. 2017) TaxID=1720313 RepID=UPI001AA0FDAD|nr:polysaccharide deacetylase family protein [Bittarella massiliensis (ex Durand et al. 2017)]MBO1680758.1 polysaccharide deacetylase family protein [Bittarella massiliensis (ex Durand et al. 2017)]